MAKKPANLTFREAAALPLAAITAWEGLVDRAGVHAGQKVLIHGGAGGVGQAAVQIAKARGADVYATGSQRSLDAIRDLGATPIDYTSESVEQYVSKYTDGEGFDVVFDTVGGPTLDASFAAVRVYTGHVVSALGWGTHSLAPLSFRGATYSGVFTLMPMLTGGESGRGSVGGSGRGSGNGGSNGGVSGNGGGSGRSREHHGEILRQVTELAEAGPLKPRLDGHVFALTEADIAKAHALVESGKSDGKVVVTVRE